MVVAVFLFAFAIIYTVAGYNGNEAMAHHYMTEGKWSDSSCGGCHFNVPEHVEGSTHVQRDIYQWSPLLNYNIEVEGKEAWAKEYGAHLPGGGALEEYDVEVDCMICHEQYGMYDADARAMMFREGDFENANAAAMAEANVQVQQDNVRKATYVLDVLTPLPILLVFHDSVNAGPTSTSCSDNCHLMDVSTKAAAWGNDDYCQYDVHSQMSCVECHTTSEHNIAGMPSMSEESLHSEMPEMKSCDDAGCHEGITHGPIADFHLDFMTCDSCHIPLLPGGERELEGGVPLDSFDWSNGERNDSYRMDDFSPVLVWSDGLKKEDVLPVIDSLVNENTGEDDSVKLMPYNVITGIWWDAGIDPQIIGDPDSSSLKGDPIPVSYVEDADSDNDGVVSPEEMRMYDGDGDGVADYPDAVLREVELYYRVSHNIAGSHAGIADPLVCADCHGASASSKLQTVHFEQDNITCETCHDVRPSVNWAFLGYTSDPAETDPPTDFSAKTIDVTIPGQKPAEVEREPAL